MTTPRRAAAVLTALAAALATAPPVLAQAQGASPAPTSAASTTAKKALVARVLELQKPGIEGLANQVAMAPAMQLRQQAAMALQQSVAPERRENAAREMEADLRKYVDEVGPPVRERALRLAPATIGAILEERFTEEELRQLVALLESPVNRKFQQVGPELQRALGERLVGETRSTVEPKVRELEQSLARRLGLQPGSGAAPAPAPAPAPAR
jgi:hypothetical protein